MITSALNDWIPYKLKVENGKLIFHWLYVSDKRFTDPFFYETIARCKSHRHNSSRFSIVSSAESLVEWTDQGSTLEPTAFIFHISRCGSTLVSQLLGLDQENIVLSEVPLLDQVLRLPHKMNEFTEEESAKILKASVMMLAKRRKGTENKLFIKLDSWHVMFYGMLRELYPQVPFILLYRSPEEVMHSHIKQRGMHMVPGVLESLVTGFDPSELTHMNMDDYAAKVICMYLEMYGEICRKDRYSYLMNYKEGVLNIIQRIADVSGFVISETVMDQMKERIGFHSKNPMQHFEEEKIVSDKDILLKFANEQYQALEMVRKRNSKDVTDLRML